MPIEIPIDFSFDVFAQEEVDIPSLPEVPEWFSLTTYRRESEPQPFELPPETLAKLQGEAREQLGSAPVLYRIHLAPGTRPEEDLHLQLGTVLAAQLAQASRGWVVDPLARRIMNAPAWAATCQPDPSAHLTFAVGQGRAQSRGMAKFGLPEVVLGVEGVDGPALEAAESLLDAICSSVVAGLYEPAEPFELAGATWRLQEAPEDRVVATPERSIAEVLAAIAAGAAEPDEE